VNRVIALGLVLLGEAVALAMWAGGGTTAATHSNADSFPRDHVARVERKIEAAGNAETEAGRESYPRLTRPPTKKMISSADKPPGGGA
jgi:hypothetical protein